MHSFVRVGDTDKSGGKFREKTAMPPKDGGAPSLSFPPFRPSSTQANVRITMMVSIEATYRCW